MSKPYSDIPGTIVFDSDQAAEGYYLNQFCISLRLAENREKFRADPEGYIDQYPMTAEQRNAALNQAARNPANTVFGAKRLIGLKISDPAIKKDRETMRVCVLKIVRNILLRC